MESKKTGVDAVDRALNLLNAFDDQERLLSLADLSRKTEMYKSTILRLAASLEAAGYLIRDDDGRFRLGPALWRLGSLYRRHFDLGEVVRPILRALSDATGETSSYYVKEGNQRLCLYRAEPLRAMRHSLTEGSTLPLDDGAAGQVLRAWTVDADDLAAVRARGFAVSFGARDPEVASVSVPVLSASGAINGALTLSGLYSHFDDDAARARFVELLLQAGKSLEAILPQGDGG